MVLSDVSHDGFSGAVVLLSSEQWLRSPRKPPNACTVKLFPGGLPAVACSGGHACMLGLCFFASHWLVAEPAALESPLTGVLIWSGT